MQTVPYPEKSSGYVNVDSPWQYHDVPFGVGGFSIINCIDANE